MKNLNDLTPDQLEKTIKLINEMIQVLFRKSLDIPMTKELFDIQDTINDIESLYVDRFCELEKN